MACLFLLLDKHDVFYLCVDYDHIIGTAAAKSFHKLMQPEVHENGT